MSLGNSVKRLEEPLLLDSHAAELFQNDNVNHEDDNAWLADCSAGDIQTCEDDCKFKNQQNRVHDVDVAVADDRRSSMKNRNSVGSILKQGDQSPSEEEWSELLPWRRRVSVSRMVKERHKQKMEQDMVRWTFNV